MTREGSFLSKIFSSIRTKFLVSFSLVVIISVAFVTYFPIQAYSERLEAASIKYSNQVISNYIGNINNYIRELDRITDSIVYNFYIQRFLIENTGDSPIKPDTLEASYSEFYQGSSDVLTNIVKLRSDISSIFIYTGDDVSLYKSRFNDVNLERASKFLQAKQSLIYKDSANTIYDIMDVDYFEGSSLALTVSRNLERYDGQGDLGIIHIDANLSTINKLGDSAVLDDSATLLIIDQNGNYVYNTPMASILELSLDTDEEREALASGLLAHSNKTMTGNYLSDLHDEAYRIVYEKMNLTGWVVATVTPQNTILSEVNEVRNSIILIIWLSLFIILLITFIITTRITKPIIHLKESMDKADHNQFNTSVEVTSNDEIGDLSLSFNHMIARIKDLMEEVVNEQEEKRAAEIKILQDQINPHFLYNTLDTIIWMTETNDENTVPMIEALSQLFRISLSRGQEFITIEDELEHIRNYLYILKIRYLDKFEYDIHSDPTIMNYQIPKIILQPLLENAIYHGIKNTENKGHIDIVAEQIGRKIIIEITDNGIGMDTETCNRLLDETVEVQSKKGSGVGVRNVNRRIKLYYGEEYGLSYHSAEGSGTTVTVTLPYE